MLFAARVCHPLECPEDIHGDPAVIALAMKRVMDSISKQEVTKGDLAESFHGVHKGLNMQVQKQSAGDSRKRRFLHSCSLT